MGRKKTFVGAALVAVSLSAGLLGQGSWSRTPTTGTMPLRAGHAAIYDLLRERMVVFGGFDANNAPQSSTAEFDGVHWADVTTPAPPARVGHAMAYDHTRDRIVMFGGVAGLLFAPFGDTWEFDGEQWALRQPANAPVGRVDLAMAYDVAGQRTLLFGGRSGQSSYGDTWLWDGVEWTQVAGTGPSPRNRLAMACDWNRGRTVLFGGFDGAVLGDTWEWDGAGWSAVATAVAPMARSNHAMAYDFSRARIVLHGGSPIGGAPNGGETWEWDGAAWTQHGATVAASDDHSLVYDARLQRTTLFGGRGGTLGTLREAVETYGYATPGAFEERGLSCPGPAGTAHLYGVTSVLAGPEIGETSLVQVRPTPFQAFFVFGWSDTIDGGVALPRDLGAFGMPGCTLQVSQDAVTSAVADNGAATMAMPIPNNPFLVGLSYFVQGLSLDPGAAGGFTTTNRLRATIGRR